MNGKSATNKRANNGTGPGDVTTMRPARQLAASGRQPAHRTLRVEGNTYIK